MVASAGFEALNSGIAPAGSAPAGAHGLALRHSRRARAPVLKRGIDVAGASFGLVVLSPVLLLVALWIFAVDGSAPIFRQNRVGFRGKPFEIFKFRTIRRRYCDPTGRTVFGDTDKRLLPLGGFLRTSRLDELPQLINILVGEMSLVGPRPHVPDMLVEGREYSSVAPLYDHRTEMAPGLTGWAQCKGLHGPVRTADEAVARLEYDLAYIRDFSILLDLKIMARTVFHVLAILKP